MFFFPFPCSLFFPLPVPESASKEHKERGQTTARKQR